MRDAQVAVHVDVFSRKDGTATHVASHVDELPGADQALFATLPRRISDRQGNPGDMVNFLIFGSDTGMKRVFSGAGWVAVDPDVRGALISGVRSSLSKEAYLTLPMSPLFLFGRPQDLGWAHAEPIRVAAPLHHLRVWRAPFPVDGSTLWVGAATQDIGFDRDWRVVPLRRTRARPEALEFRRRRVTWEREHRTVGRHTPSSCAMLLTMHEKEVIVIATIKVKAGVEDRARQLLQSAVAPTRLEAGCLNYDLHQSSTDPTEFLFHETWESDEALAAHSTSTAPHRAALRQQLGELIGAPPSVTRWRRVNS